jgi:hypothetical protein
MTGRSVQSFSTRQALEMQELAGTYRLGAPIAAYRGGLTKGLAYIINVIVALASVICFFVIWESLIKHNSTNPLLAIGLVVLVVGLIATALIWLISLPAQRRKRTWHVYVFSDGFVFTREGYSDVARWEEVRAIWHQIMRRSYGRYGGYTRHIYIVERFDGHRVVFDDKIKKVEQLGNLLNEQITNAMWPRTLADYQAGKVISFGPLSVSQQGVSNGRTLLPWTAIKEIKFEREGVKVHQKGKLLNWGKVSVEEIPNPLLLRALTRSVIGK